MVPIEYRGELVALVSERRTHIVSPRLVAAPAGDPDLRLVAYMCLCCGEVLRGNLQGPYTQELGELWAQQAVAVAHTSAHGSALCNEHAAGHVWTP